MNNLRNLLLGTALAAVAWPALAHGDEDHSEPNPVVAAVPMAAQGPRAEAQTDAFELVATLAQDRLVLHIDRFDTNEPVVGAQVEVDTGSVQAKATPSSPGVYWMAQGTLGQGESLSPAGPIAQVAHRIDCLTCSASRYQYFLADKITLETTKDKEFINN